MEIVWSGMFGVVIGLVFGYILRMVTEKLSQDESHRIGTVKMKLSRADDDYSKQYFNVVFIVEEIECTGELSKIKVKDISGISGIYHEEAKGFLGKYVPTNEVSWHDVIA